MKYLSILVTLVMVILFSACQKTPISGLTDALIAYNEAGKDLPSNEKMMEMSLDERREVLSKRDEKRNQAIEKIQAEAVKLNGATLPVADDRISEIEPLKMTLVENDGAEPEFRLNGKFKIEKDIELDVWNDEWHGEKLRNGAMARVDLASPKVEEEGVQNSFEYSPLAFVGKILVSVENGVIIAKAGTIIDIDNAKLEFRNGERYIEIYKNASKIWLQPVGIVAE